ncbi:MAG: hypothetical protein JJ899_09270, partial [Alphaproteobacteria bacterium]|nr:hypothetical protein [Alphaproteobacteria bacterium]
MSVVQQARQGLGDALRRRSIHKHRSRIGWQDAPRYSRYLARAQRAFAGDPPALAPGLDAALAEFRRDGATSFVTSDTTAIARRMFEQVRQRESGGETIWADDTEERGQHN